MPFRILLTDDAGEELKALRAYDRKAVVEGIEVHLKDEPTKESKSRIRKLIQPSISEYRLRVGDFRVYYDVDDESQQVIVIQILDKGRGLTPKETEP